MPEKLKKYYETKAAIEKLRNELEKLSRDESLKADLAVQEEVRAILDKYSRQPKDLVALFDLKVAEPEKPPQTGGRKVKTRKARPLKVYTNPHTGAVVRTKGANHKILKAWKAKYGADTVEGWLAQQ